MKTEAQIERKLKDVKYKYLSREYADKLSVKPCNCVHNHRHSPVYPRIGSKGLIEIEPDIGLCMYGSEDITKWPGDICDDIETARSCPLFELKNDKSKVLDTFQTTMSDDHEVAYNYKDIAALQWVLDQTIIDIPMSKWQIFKLWCFMQFCYLNVWLSSQGLI